MSGLQSVRVALFLLGTSLAWPWQTECAERSSPQDMADQVDRLLEQELPAGDKQAGLADDETFVRRVWLDLVGSQPTAEELTLFALDPSPDKRQRLVRRLLADERFGVNWGRYWRDVILYRQTDPRGRIAAQSLESYLSTQLNTGASWKDIVHGFITAGGDVRENGQTALFMAHLGGTEEITAEVSRIFMGIQIQCAQCHDHPTDRWKREQFHELAAFFPRVAVRPVRQDGRLFTYQVVSFDSTRLRRRPGNMPGPQAEHFMPDLEDPSAAGTQMEPKFFVTGRSLEPGVKDEERRRQLADWLTAGSNPWFAKAHVNRLWAELVGEGFYEPVDDMGPDRACSAPHTLTALADGFVAGGHDVKWLLESIMLTDAYQRASRDRRNPTQTPFAANCPQRLRSDQLYTTITAALGLQDVFNFGGSRPGAGGGLYGRGGGLRFLFEQTFGYDPSEPRDEVSGSIPQALLLMNSPLINGAIDADRPGSQLAQFLRDIKDDEALTVELYLRCLARQPTEKELKTCLDHVSQVSNRREAFEDLLWALINSTEFLYRK